MKNKNKVTLTKLDASLLKYLQANKVASCRQINRDIYQNHRPQSSRRCLKRLKDGNIIKAIEARLVGDKSHLYSLTKEGFRIVRNYLEITLVSDRVKSDSIEHDLVLVDIREMFLSKSIVKYYYSENQIQSYATFNDDESLKVFKELNFDAAAFCKKENGRGAHFGIQYEQNQKTRTNYKRILTDYYIRNDLNFILYVCVNQSIENTIKEIEKEISKSSDKKIYFIQLKNLFTAKNVIKFANQENEIIQII